MNLGRKICPPLPLIQSLMQATTLAHRQVLLSRVMLEQKQLLYHIYPESEPDQIQPASDIN